MMMLMLAILLEKIMSTLYDDEGFLTENKLKRLFYRNSIVARDDDSYFQQNKAIKNNKTNPYFYTEFNLFES